MVAIVIYCLVKKKLVRCCEGESTAHDIKLEEGSNRSKAQVVYLPSPPQPSAPSALQHQAPHASTQIDLENALARLQSQNTVLINQLTAQSKQTQQQKTTGASEVTRFNSQYPVV